MIVELVQGHLRNHPGQGDQPGSQCLLMRDQVQRPLLGCMDRVELVDPPQQRVDRASPGGHQRLSPIDEHLGLPRHRVMGGHRQRRLPQERPSHREGVDRVGLATGPGDAALLGHHLRRHPHHLLTGGQQVPLQPGRQMPAVLDRPPQVEPELAPSPRQRPSVSLARSRDGALPDLAPDRVNRDERVRALVDIGSNNNHGGCLLHLISDWTVGPVGGHTSVGAMPRSYQVTPAGPSHPMPAQRMLASPKTTPSLRARHQVLRIQPPRERHHHPDTEPNLARSGSVRAWSRCSDRPLAGGSRLR